MTVAELSVKDLGGMVATNGYRGELRGVAVADDPAYVEVKIDAVTTWVRPSQECRIGDAA